LSTGIWWGQPVEDFELRFSYKLIGPPDPGSHSFSAIYRGNNLDLYSLVLGQEGIAALKSQSRHLASVGERTVAKQGSEQRIMVGALADEKQVASWFHREDWNDVVILVEGSHHVFAMNGHTIMEFTDEDAVKRISKGDLGFSVWNRELPFTQVQLKNIRLKSLSEKSVP